MSDIKYKIYINGVLCGEENTLCEAIAWAEYHLGVCPVCRGKAAKIEEAKTVYVIEPEKR